MDLGDVPGRGAGRRVGRGDRQARSERPPVLWLKQFGSATDDQATALSIAGKGLYVAGSTTGELPDGTPLGESDGFLRKYLPNGTEVWTRQFGTADYDAVYGMASDPRGVVAVGTTHGAFEGQTNAGDRDVFLVKIAFS